MPFINKLQEAQASTDSRVCVGLDPDPARMPRHLLVGTPIDDAVVHFNTAIIEATQSSACAYKLNFAFYEALGEVGYRVLKRTIDIIPDGKITVADGKRGDIGNSAQMYARAVFEKLGCDACTVAPYMGEDAVRPFLVYPEKAAFVLARTSNPGSKDFQEHHIDGHPLYLEVARRTQDWAKQNSGTGGLVVGATRPESIVELREACPELPFLLPGVGAQGGDPVTAVRAGTRSGAPVLINSSRSIIYASTGKHFARDAGDAAEKLRQQLLIDR
jgi:orotidine-5'-phosphate decarboxylase